ncbi:lysophospholipid acyltransferase family protein [Thiolapillus sp.]
MNRLLRFIWYRVIVRLVVLLALGVNLRHRERLPGDGPAIIVANHNSHLDTMVLMNLLPARLLPRVQPVAAADYFLKNRLLAWFALNIIGILPLSRRPKKGEDLFAGIDRALKENRILIIFPEGSRGEPERLAHCKQGVARIKEAHPEVPVIPVYLHGLGKALPKGEALLVPFFCDVFVGEAVAWTGERRSYTAAVEEALKALEEEGAFLEWE